MKRLSAGMPVTLELDGLRALRCVVTAVDAGGATLVQTEQADGPMARCLQHGGAGFLIFSSATMPVGLRGRAIMPPEQSPLIRFAALPD